MLGMRIIYFWAAWGGGALLVLQMLNQLHQRLTVK